MNEGGGGGGFDERGASDVSRRTVPAESLSPSCSKSTLWREGRSVLATQLRRGGTAPICVPLTSSGVHVHMQTQHNYTNCRA